MKLLVRILFYVLVSPILLIIIIVASTSTTVLWAFNDAPLRAKSDRWIDIFHYKTDFLFQRNKKDADL